jgi:aminopeptidase-like protein
MNKKTFEKFAKFRNVLIGEGCKEMLTEIGKEIPELRIFKECSGSVFGDWTIPQEWINSGGHLRSSCGKIDMNLGDHPLRLMQYSDPLDILCSSKDIEKFVHVSEVLPESIPYVTNYYGDGSAICMTSAELELIKSLDSEIHIKIDTAFKKGNLYFGEILIPGESDKEILISSYICHPWMANNELSGPLLWIELVKYLKSISTKFSYRFILVPETIGSIVYCNKFEKELKERIQFGLNLTCIGDERAYSMISTPNGNTIVDRIIRRSLVDKDNPHCYSWLFRGSDERQYNSPRMDLNVVSLCRSRFGDFDEYHTCADIFGRTVTEKGMRQSLRWVKDILWLIENNNNLESRYIGEPHMSKYNLYPKVSISSQPKNRIMMNFLSLCDNRDLLSIAEYLNLSITEAKRIYETLLSNSLITVSR